MNTEKGLTPAMQQYYELKEQIQDGVLFFRMGDFYEMFGDDAQIAHNVLGVALTTRNKNALEPIPLAGIPFHAKEKYLPKLVEAGYKVAIAEQVSDPKLKGIVKREIVRVVTPATLHIEMGNEAGDFESNIILCVVKEKEGFGMSYIDASNNSWVTGEFENFDALQKQVARLFPKEVILDKALFGDVKIQEVFSKKYGINIYYFQSAEKPREVLLKHFGIKNLEGFGIENKFGAQKSSATLIEYVKNLQKNDVLFFDSLKYETFSGFLDLDESTIKSLDILFNVFTKSPKIGTLFGVLHHTKTAMGSRLLRESIVKPLVDGKQIQARYDFIEQLVQDKNLLDTIQGQLKLIADIDTLLTRLALGRAHPRDLLSLKRSLSAIICVYEIIEKSDNSTIKKILFTK